MSAETRTCIDLVCDAEGCSNELSEYSDSGYADEQHAREMAPEYDWQCTPDGRDLCPQHIEHPEEDERDDD